MRFNVDSTLPVPLGVQLRGLIEYGIACAQLMPGERLPSVREMAGDLGIAPMTVSQVYKELQAAGLIEGRRGRGTFVSAGASDLAKPQVVGLQRRIDEVIREAVSQGVSAAELAHLFNARLARTASPSRSLRLALIGIFPEATRAYASDIRKRLPPGDAIWPTTLEELATSDLARQRTLAADAIVTFPNRKAEVADLVGDRVVLAIHFIPSEATRSALAKIDPMARLGVVSTLPEFLATMRAGVRQFTPHVRDLEAMVLDSPDLGQLLERVDVVVYATGSEKVRELSRRGVAAIEYRHAPDPRDIDDVLLPALDELRATAAPPRSAAG